MDLVRAVSVLEVSDPAVWAEILRIVPSGLIGEELSPTRRVVEPGFDKQLAALADRGLIVLMRTARRPAAEADATPSVDGLPERVQRVLFSAARHAVDGVVFGSHAWHPTQGAPAVRMLVGGGFLEPLEEPGAPGEPFTGRYRILVPVKPPAEPIGTYADAVMEAPDDLEAPNPGPVGLLHDLAALAATIPVVGPKRTLQGTIGKPDAKRIAARLGVEFDGIEADPRWGRALRALEALRAVSTDGFTRQVTLDPHVEQILEGELPDVVDALIQRLIEADLRPALPFVRAALRDAGTGALDEVVLLDLLRELHRDVLYPGTYGARPFDDTGWDEVETPAFRTLFSRMARLGLIRRAPGVIAATEDGRAWARAAAPHPPPPIWVTSDLEVMVPPGAISPWERFQLERMTTPIARDTVDRLRLDRAGLTRWLEFHEVDEAVELLRRRSPGVPEAVIEALRTWAGSATRIVLWRGVVLP